MKKAKVIMVQGTASSVGKSIIVAALCRIFKQDGYKAAPFKAQNMALNSFVTAEGGEIGRAQVVQAEAAGIAPTVDMNPVLLKPATDSMCQVIVLGKVERTISARDYYQYTPALLETITKALERLRAAYDVVVIEGAGSPAEINLKNNEIVNMRVARLARAPVLLTGDIDRGGVFASLVGTLELLDKYEKKLVKGLIINKFRGDINLLKPGLEFLEKRTGLPVLGVIPYFHDIRIPQEDSVYLDERKKPPHASHLQIALIRLPHISNYDDFDPLEQDGIAVSYITWPFELGNPHLIIIPGTKSTVADLAYLRGSGLAAAILERAKRGTPVIGICGGYQMLGSKILDTDNVESAEKEVPGLGLLDAVTEFAPEKSTSQVKARVTADVGLLAGTKGQEITGYEIHMGHTKNNEKSSPFRVIASPQGTIDYPDGAINEKGTIIGTYMHGLLHNDDFREALLNNLRHYWDLAENSRVNLNKEKEYDKLAGLIRGSLDIKRIYRIIEGDSPVR